jgi:hypothetical protein
MFPMKPGNSSFFITCSRLDETRSRVFLPNSNLPLNQDGQSRLNRWISSSWSYCACNAKPHTLFVSLADTAACDCGVEWTFSRDIAGSVPSYLL